MAEAEPEALVAPTEMDSTSRNEKSVPSQPPSSSPASAQKPQQTSSTPAAYPTFEFPSNLPTPPFIDVDGVPNFRSLGGFLSANGTHITRPNLFYRCAHPTQITPRGLEQLTTTLGVKAIYDLRSRPEVDRTAAGVAASASAAAATSSSSSSNNAPNTTPQHPTITSQTPLFQSLRHFNPVYATEDYGPEALARKLGWYSSTPQTPSTLPYAYSEGFVNAYRDIATHGTQCYKTMFEHILHRPADPFVFHCTAGKDRTGVFAALLLRLAGVDDETICWEYALTEPGLGEWRRVFIHRMSSPSPSGSSSSEPRSSLGGGISREEAARVCGSRAGNMRAWLTLVLDGEFGGAEKYLSLKCGFGDDDVLAIKANLVVDLKSVEAREDGVVVVRPCAVDGWTPDGGCVD